MNWKERNMKHSCTGYTYSLTHSHSTGGALNIRNIILVIFLSPLFAKVRNKISTECLSFSATIKNHWCANRRHLLFLETLFKIVVFFAYFYWPPRIFRGPWITSSENTNLKLPPLNCTTFRATFWCFRKFRVFTSEFEIFSIRIFKMFGITSSWKILPIFTWKSRYATCFTQSNEDRIIVASEASREFLKNSFWIESVSS